MENKKIKNPLAQCSGERYPFKSVSIIFSRWKKKQSRNVRRNVNRPLELYFFVYIRLCIHIYIYKKQKNNKSFLKWRESFRGKHGGFAGKPFTRTPTYNIRNKQSETKKGFILWKWRMRFKRNKKTVCGPQCLRSYYRCARMALFFTRRKKKIQ